MVYCVGKGLAMGDFWSEVYNILSVLVPLYAFFALLAWLIDKFRDKKIKKAENSLWHYFVCFAGCYSGCIAYLYTIFVIIFGWKERLALTVSAYIIVIVLYPFGLNKVIKELFAEVRKETKKKDKE